ncbi:tyrosine-type recombinase/integrase [Alphaproteobacteria bacterium]|nr:tyrosine-type recombinase/integrase [Alphaproteobacteria bacterium]
MHKLKHKQLLHLTNGKHHDGKGLYISILSQGRGKWSYRYRIDNKSREMGLGTFPEISIVDARQKAEDNRRLVLNKIDPIEDKRKQEVLRKQQNKKFSYIPNLYITAKKKEEWRNPKSEQQWRNTITNYAVPYLDKKPLIDINTDDIHELLLPIWSSKTETARRLQQRLFRIFGFAKIKKWYVKDNPALWKGGLQEVMPDPYKIHKVISFASLKHNEISKFYQAISDLDLIAVYALRLLILTATRTKEVIESRFDEFNLDKKMWTIPEHKMKTGIEHKVLLSDEAVNIINLMRKRHNHEYVFHNPATGKHISNGAMLVFLKKQFPQLKITVHGFRATFKTWAEETGNYQHHAIEFCLAHELPNKVEKAYLRTNLTEQRKVIMKDWEKYVLYN